MQFLLKRFVHCFAITLSLLSLGCGSGDQPELGTVAGIVTLDGKPLPNVELSFAPDNGRPSYGETSQDGKFELVYIRDVKGAKVGRHNITVHSKKVDNSKLKPVEVQAGTNLINIECVTRSSTPVINSSGEDD